MGEVDILGIPFAKVTQDEALNIMEEWLDSSENHVIVTPNPEGVMQSRRNEFFEFALKTVHLRLADGIGIVLASKVINNPLPERVRGVDTIFNLFDRLDAKGRDFTAYFLGGKPGVAEKAKTRMEEKYPHLKVVGLHHGFFDRHSSEEQEIIMDINKLRPDILLVCMGMPRAEIWASRNRWLDTRLTLCLGGTLDIMSGEVLLAPAFVRKIGMEWLYRLIREPSRLKRQLDIPRFIWAVLLNSLMEKFGGSDDAEKPD